MQLAFISHSFGDISVWIAGTIMQESNIAGTMGFLYFLMGRSIFPWRTSFPIKSNSSKIVTFYKMYVLWTFLSKEVFSLLTFRHTVASVLQCLCYAWQDTALMHGMTKSSLVLKFSALVGKNTFWLWVKQILFR